VFTMFVGIYILDFSPWIRISIVLQVPQIWANFFELSHKLLGYKHLGKAIRHFQISLFQSKLHFPKPLTLIQIHLQSMHDGVFWSEIVQQVSIDVLPLYLNHIPLWLFRVMELV
jgi:hypothetical protein